MRSNFAVPLLYLSRLWICPWFLFKNQSRLVKVTAEYTRGRFHLHPQSWILVEMPPNTRGFLNVQTRTQFNGFRSDRV